MVSIDWSRFDWRALTEGWANDLRVAMVFFTRLPIKSEGEISGEAVGNALRAWPLVGLAIGLAGGLVFALASTVGLAPLPSALCAVAATAVLTGALHEDGLSDFADAMGGRDMEARLAIMRDSRAGVFGALALILSVGLRASILAQIATPGLVIASFAAAAASSRGLVPLMLTKIPPARPDGLGAMLGEPKQETIVTAALIALVTNLVLIGFASGLVATVLGLGAVWLAAALARSRIGGYTGDVMGAAQQIAEIGVLMAAAIAA